MQPTIRSEQDIYNSLAGVYDPQTQLINQQVSQVDVDAAAQQASLDQAKVNAFKDIDLSANRKGMLFSGFSPDQQATYLGTKYLPAVANLKSSSINAKNTLTAQLNKLSADRRTQAIQGVTEDTKAFNDYVKEQNTAAYRNAQLSISQARLAQSGANAAAKAPTEAANLRSNAQMLAAELNKVRGQDGYVSPKDYAKALQLWNGQGFKAADFHDLFAGYRNPTNNNYNTYNQFKKKAA